MGLGPLFRSTKSKCIEAISKKAQSMDLAKFSLIKVVTLKVTLKIIRRMVGEYSKVLMENLRKENTWTINSMAKDRSKTTKKSMKDHSKMENTTDLEI